MTVKENENSKVYEGGMMESENEEDIEFLIQSIRISIQVVIDKLNIACIDKKHRESTY